MPSDSIVDPYGNFNFLIELDGISEASFSECSGLDSTTEPTEYREGGDNMTIRKISGKTTYSDIVLKRGVTDSDELWKWRKNIIQGKKDRRNGSIVLYDSMNAKEVVRWNFFRAWPTKWEGPALDAKANEIAVETLTLAHEKIERV